MLLTRIGLALVVTSLAVRGGSAGAAEPAALQLEWSAPGGCPQAAEVRALTAGVLGREIAEDGSAATRGGLRAAEGPRAPVVTPELEPLEAVERVAPAAARRLRFGVRVAGVFDVGGTPGPTGGLMLAGALIGRRWRVEALGLWLAPRTTRPDPALPLEARVGLLAAGLRGCGVPGRGVIEVPLCGGVEAGALRGAGSGAALAEPGTDALPWLAVTAGPGLVWSPVPRVGLGLTLDVVVPLLPRRFAVAGFGDVYSPAAPVAGRALASLELRFR